MKLVNRKTEFWRETTPSKVGPGTYEAEVSPSPQVSSVPFNNSEKRTLSAPKAYVAVHPGPGSYRTQRDWSRGHVRSASNYSLSKSPRMLPFAPGVSGFVLPSNYTNPGPGTYDAATHARSGSSHARARQTSLIVEPSPSSIPVKPSKPNQIGPTYYNPDYNPTKRSQRKSTTFGSYKSKRKVFEPSHEGEPGPGDYIQEYVTDARSSWLFCSKTERPVLSELKKTDKPGPGTYEPETGNEKPPVTVEGFGSTARRDIPTSSDPHRPYVVGSFSVPPTGTYSTKEQLEKQEMMKQKFVSFEIPAKKAPFGISEKKTGPWRTNNLPGPGDYEVSKQHPPSSVNAYGSKAARFNYKSTENLPGPGTYEEKEKKKTAARRNSVQFQSKTPRFDDLAGNNPNVKLVGKKVKIGPYLTHENWSAKQTRASDSATVNPKISFDSSSIRHFQRENKQTPGPGTYHVRPKTVPSVPKTTSRRFEAYGAYDYKGASNIDLGPGKYHKDSNFVQKSFNMIGEHNKEKPWI